MNPAVKLPSDYPYIINVLVIVYPCGIVFDAFAERGISENCSNQQDNFFCRYKVNGEYSTYIVSS